MTQLHQNFSIWTSKQRDLSFTIYNKDGTLADLTGAVFSYTIKHRGGVITIVPTVSIPTSNVTVSILSTHSSQIDAGQNVDTQLLLTKGGIPYPPAAIGVSPVYQSDG